MANPNIIMATKHICPIASTTRTTKENLAPIPHATMITKKGKFNPAVLVTLDDMTYESDG